MKKTVVVYKSVSGFTKKYAEWISEELHADLFDLRQVDSKILSGFDIFIYGGSLHASGVNGYSIFKKKLKNLYDKQLIVFAVGASPKKDDLIKEITEDNFTSEELSRIKFYYLRGGFDFNKLNFTNKILMTLFKWKILLKKNRTPDEKGMLSAYSKPQDFTKREYINEILDYVKLIF
jgi:menaquinone-dependent protoporphyrinogen IX oxidase